MAVHADARRAERMAAAQALRALLSLQTYRTLSRTSLLRFRRLFCTACVEYKVDVTRDVQIVKRIEKDAARDADRVGGVQACMQPRGGRLHGDAARCGRETRYPR